MAEAVLLAALLAFLFAHALWSGWQRKRKELAHIAGQAAIAAWLDDPISEAESATTLRRLPLDVRVALCVQSAPSLPEAKQERLRSTAEKTGVTRHALKLLTSWWWWRRVQGARVLMQLGYREFFGFEPPLLRDRHPMVRAQGALCATLHPSPDIIEELLVLLNDKNSECRFGAQYALRRIGAAAVEPLTHYLSQHKGVTTVSALQMAVGLADARMTGPAIRLCEDASPVVREWAARLLGAIGDSRTASPLLVLLEDSEPGPRAAAALSLGRLGHPQAAPALYSLLHTGPQPMQKEAAQALSALGPEGRKYLQLALDEGANLAVDTPAQLLAKS
jgi:hypothetical protein